MSGRGRRQPGPAGRKARRRRRGGAGRARDRLLGKRRDHSARPASRPGQHEPQPATLAQYYAQHLSWQPCDNGFQCARLVVPFDYAHPGGGKRFSLPVVKLPATDPSHRVGALVVNPGGPGGSGARTRSGRAASSRPRCGPGSTSWASTRAAWRAASPRWPA